MSKQVADALRAGLKAFGPNGENWVQGGNLAFVPPHCCVMTALPKDRTDDDRKVFYACRALLEKASGTNDAVEWNDKPGRKFSEVKALYLQAIALAEPTQPAEHREGTSK